MIVPRANLNSIGAVCFLLAALGVSCKHGGHDHSGVGSTTSTAASTCTGAARDLIGKEEDVGPHADLPAFQSKGFQDSFEPKNVARLANESSSKYVARLERTLAELGGGHELQALKARRGEWDKLVAELFHPLDAEKLTPTLKRDGVEVLTDEEFEIFSKEYSHNRTAYKGMMELLSQPEELYERMEEIELKTLIEMRTAAVDHNVAMESVLTRIERKAGFGPVVDIPEDLATSQDFWTILRARSPFRDRFDLPERYGHGVQTHRVQFAAIIQDMETNPGRYFKAGDYYFASVSDLYVSMGNERVRGRMIYGATPYFESLFNTFDSFGYSGSSPEFFRNLYLHGLGGDDSLR